MVYSVFPAEHCCHLPILQTECLGRKTGRGQYIALKHTVFPWKASLHVISSQKAHRQHRGHSVSQCHGGRVCDPALGSVLLVLCVCARTWQQRAHPPVPCSGFFTHPDLRKGPLSGQGCRSLFCTQKISPCVSTWVTGSPSDWWPLVCQIQCKTTRSQHMGFPCVRTTHLLTILLFVSGKKLLFYAVDVK